MAVLSGLLAACGVTLARRGATYAGLVQSPNARSSHSIPTPTGGGIGIVMGGSLAAIFIAVSTSFWPAALVLVASLGIAGLGLWDDLRSIAPGIRLVIQAVIVGVTLALGVPLPVLATAIGFPLAPPILLLLVGLALVYWVNLFNFMDGIDGLAASEAIFLFVAPLGLGLLSVPDIALQPLFWWLLALATASMVFLAFNWQPAKIFMGDVGSTYLGFMIATLALFTVANGWLSIWQWLILTACFVTDASATLLQRGLRGEALFEAHRRHAYQVLSRRLGSYRQVVLIVAAINVIALLPLAAGAGAHSTLGPLLTLTAYIPLIALVLWAGAGRPEHA
jgi:Fuc2NAc and GlcNAc transferase